MKINEYGEKYQPYKNIILDNDNLYLLKGRLNLLENSISLAKEKLKDDDKLILDLSLSELVLIKSLIENLEEEK